MCREREKKRSRLHHYVPISVCLSKSFCHCLSLGLCLFGQIHIGCVSCDLLYPSKQRKSQKSHPEMTLQSIQICMPSFKCGLFLAYTHTKVQPSDKRQWVTGMLIRFCRNCFIIIRFAAHSLYFENNLWSLVAGWLYLTVQVNMGPQIWRLPSRLSLRGDIS